MIPAILRRDYEGIDPFQISDALLTDDHDLVQKGYGWMLKCLSQVDMDAVKEYLIANHAQMPGTAICMHMLYHCTIDIIQQW